MDEYTLRLVHAAIRKAFLKSPQYQRCIRDALSDQVGPRGGVRLKCCKCKAIFPPKECEINHREPVTEYHRRQKSYSPEEYYQRVFTPVENLELTCKPCHKKITKEQNKMRKKKI